MRILKKEITKKVQIKGTKNDTYVLDAEVQEIWAVISGFSRYEVSTWGRIRNRKTRRLMNVRQLSPKYKRGYLRVVLKGDDGYRRSVYIHEAVAKAFVSNPFNYPIVDHVDKDRDNNHPWNLMWSTKEYLKERYAKKT